GVQDLAARPCVGEGHWLAARWNGDPRQCNYRSSSQLGAKLDEIGEIGNARDQSTADETDKFAEFVEDRTARDARAGGEIDYQPRARRRTPGATSDRAVDQNTRATGTPLERETSIPDLNCAVSSDALIDLAVGPASQHHPVVRAIHCQDR